MSAPTIIEKPTTDAEIVLARCRRAILQLKLAEASIEEAAVPLRHGWISAAGAVVTLRDLDVLHLVLPELDRENEV